MNTSNNGNDNQVDAAPDAKLEPTKGSGRFWLWIGLIAVLFVGALIVGGQMMGVLYGIVFPPMPPRPTELVEIQHTNEAHGVDNWLYQTASDACQLTRYYESQGGSCIIAPEMCTAGFINQSSVTTGENVSQCTGTTEFSLFEMRWQTIIATGYGSEYPTQFKLSREVFWSGSVPPVNFEQLIEGIEADATPESTTTP